MSVSAGNCFHRVSLCACNSHSLSDNQCFLQGYILQKLHCTTVIDIAHGRVKASNEPFAILYCLIFRLLRCLIFCSNFRYCSTSSPYRSIHGSSCRNNNSSIFLVKHQRSSTAGFDSLSGWWIQLNGRTIIRYKHQHQSCAAICRYVIRS